MSKKYKIIGLSLIVAFLLSVIYIAPLGNKNLTPKCKEIIRPMKANAENIKAETAKPVDARTGAIENDSLEWKDILFLGDSLTVGLNSTCCLEEYGSTIEAEVGRGIEACLDSISGYSDFKVVIVTIGTNSYSIDNETFKSTYEDIIEKILENNSECIVYVSTIPPCEEEKAKITGYAITNKAIEEKNEIIKELDNVIVLDINEELKDKGYSTMDGIHLESESYEVWFEFLKEKLNIIE